MQGVRKTTPTSQLEGVMDLQLRYSSTYLVICTTDGTKRRAAAARIWLGHSIRLLYVL